MVLRYIIDWDESYEKIQSLRTLKKDMVLHCTAKQKLFIRDHVPQKINNYRSPESLPKLVTLIPHGPICHFDTQDNCKINQTRTLSAYSMYKIMNEKIFSIMIYEFWTALWYCCLYVTLQQTIKTELRVLDLRQTNTDYDGLNIFAGGQLSVRPATVV